MKNSKTNQPANDTTGTGCEGGDELEKKEGYSSMFHRTREQTYGPDSIYDAKAKVFEFILHSRTRWPKHDPKGKLVTKDDIKKATGLHYSQIHKSVTTLEKAKWIDSIKTKIGKVHYATQYRLNEKTFPCVDVPKKHELSLIQGGRGVPPEMVGGVLPDVGGGVLPDVVGGGYTQVVGITREKAKKNRLNNILNKDINNSLIGNDKIDPTNWGEVKAFWLNIFPDDERRLIGALKHLSNDSKVKHPIAYILKAWIGIRKDYAHLDRPVQTITLDVPFDEDAADEAREIAMAEYWANNKLRPR